MKVYYFGCCGQTGHYMFNSDLSIAHDMIAKNPWAYNIDGGLCPKGPQNEGRAFIHHKDGWTALSFWDRSVDHRNNSNSNFIAEGTFTFDEMMKIARETFPRIFKRFNFEIVEVKE